GDDGAARIQAVPPADKGGHPPRRSNTQRPLLSFLVPSLGRNRPGSRYDARNIPAHRAPARSGTDLGGNHEGFGSLLGGQGTNVHPGYREWSKSDLADGVSNRPRAVWRSRGYPVRFEFPHTAFDHGDRFESARPAGDALLP